MKAILILGFVTTALGHFPVRSKDGDPNFQWGYEPYNGPNVWPKYFPACGDQKQSPIALPAQRHHTSNNKVVHKLSHKNFEQPCCVILNNKATTFDFSCKEKEGEKQRLTGGSLYHHKRRFKFYSGHIHWGKDSTDGSEHSIGGVKHQAEAHLIHYDAKFDSVTEALDEPGAIIVQAFFLQSTKEDNLALNWLLDSLYKINGTLDTQTDIGEMPLFDADGRSIFEPTANSFYVYEGSLTTPPCNEVVVFHVYTTPTPISERQLNILRSLVNHEGENMSGNFRNIQPLYQRPILLRADKHDKKLERVQKHDFKAKLNKKLGSYEDQFGLNRLDVKQRHLSPKMQAKKFLPKPKKFLPKPKIFLPKPKKFLPKKLLHKPKKLLLKPKKLLLKPKKFLPKPKNFLPKLRKGGSRKLRKIGRYQPSKKKILIPKVMGTRKKVISRDGPGYKKK